MALTSDAIRSLLSAQQAHLREFTLCHELPELAEVVANAPMPAVAIRLGSWLKYVAQWIGSDCDVTYDLQAVDSSIWRL